MGPLTKSLDTIEQNASPAEVEESSRNAVRQLLRLTESKEIHWSVSNVVPAFLKASPSVRPLVYASKSGQTNFILVVLQSPYQSSSPIITLVTVDSDLKPIFVFPYSVELDSLHSAIVLNIASVQQPEEDQVAENPSTSTFRGIERAELLNAAEDYRRQSRKLEYRGLLKQRITLIFLFIAVLYFGIGFICTIATISEMYARNFALGEEINLIRRRVLLGVAFIFFGSVIGAFAEKVYSRPKHRTRNNEEQRTNFSKAGKTVRVEQIKKPKRRSKIA